MQGFKLHSGAPECRSDDVQILEIFCLADLCQPFGGFSRVNRACNPFTSVWPSVKLSLSISFLIGVMLPSKELLPKNFASDDFALSSTSISTSDLVLGFAFFFLIWYNFNLSFLLLSVWILALWYASIHQGHTHRFVALTIGARSHVLCLSEFQLQ